ncbi:2-amino-4-hydroxy-6-hydroxymethyldihydropteridine diphosphokinase [Marinobacter sp.]|uniref:2-amino-4-hydroxy-6- hydroxymethyldihydropteridine diphosphokinase n=1 Tax=Marinobacter sp. TaxID=50741 RepID=UPI002B46CBA3|nr:2-amino-4-hydroxy-6-hydroxymethyldihydropteridine diphosphokinase [Marinobacter sp.]HKK55731.1 2-amino-4-hydroxy-6-hydroxymethyldihydropteridine diphosphokinase [Marinobacter sp.]
MARVYISIGSNIEREKNVLSALDTLHQWFGDLLLSPVYESEAVGFVGESFLNLVVGVDTTLSVGELSARLRQLEADNGRRRGIDVPKFSGRTLDLDILIYGNEVGQIAGVDLPRGEILQNAFVLKPLADVAPQDCHPVCDKTYSALWQSYDRDQKLWPVDFTWQGQTISRAV